MLGQPYHYKECGLDNVFIYNMPTIEDMNGEQTFYIKKINLLHRAIAEGIIRKNGLLNAKEIRFLRTEMGYTQKQFSEVLGKEAQACGRWERGENPIDKTTDSLIRISASDYLRIKSDLEEIASRNSLDEKAKNIDIDGANYQYKLIAA